MDDVRKVVPAKERKEAWAVRTGKDLYEFHFGDFDYHCDTCCLSSAKALGWGDYLSMLEERRK